MVISKNTSPKSLRSSRFDAYGVAPSWVCAIPIPTKAIVQCHPASGGKQQPARAWAKRAARAVFGSTAIGSLWCRAQSCWMCSQNGSVGAINDVLCQMPKRGERRAVVRLRGFRTSTRARDWPQTSRAIQAESPEDPDCRRSTEAARSRRPQGCWSPIAGCPVRHRGRIESSSALQQCKKLRHEDFDFVA